MMVTSVLVKPDNSPDDVGYVEDCHKDGGKGYNG